MAKNNLTPLQDLLVREFYVDVAVEAEKLLPGAPAFARQLRSICLLLLNYDQIGSGVFVTKGTEIKVPYGSSDFTAYPDEWAVDFDTALTAISIGEGNETSDDTDKGEASTSEPSEDSTVREAVLPKDV